MKSIIALVAGLIMGGAGTVRAAEKTFNPVDFGAVSGGTQLCTAAFQQAIDAAGKAGGVVHVPAGVFLSGALELRSGVTVELAEGATLLGSRELGDYNRAPVPGDSGFRNLLHGTGLRDVVIRGKGTIDGNGDAFRDDKKRRPKNLYFEGCTNVLVEDLRLRNSGSWMQNYKLCERVTLRGLDVFNHVTFNNDGLDIDSSRDVVIERCTVDSDDDGICLKSTTGTPCRNVRISDCTVSSHCNALKMGTESGGGFIDITISNCTVSSPRHTKKIYGEQRGEAGIALEIVDGGRMDNVTVTDVRITGVTVPIFLRLGDRGRPYATGKRPAVGTLRNVRIANITAEQCSPMGCPISGLPGHRIENVVFENIRLGFEGGGNPDNMKRRIEEKPDKYPDCRMFGELPAYGFFCRHVANLRFINVALSTATPDPRHALVFDDATGVAIDGLQLVAAPAAAAPIRLDGEKTREVTLRNSELKSAKDVVDLSPGVPRDAFRQLP